MKVSVVQDILSANDQLAAQNRKLFDAHGICVINVMASPGGGKTSLISVSYTHLTLPTN